MSGFFPAGGGGGGSASPISQALLGSNAASISCAGISALFKTLLIVWSKAQTNVAATNTQSSIIFNNDSTIGHYGQGTGPGGLGPGFGSPGIQIQIPGTSSGLQPNGSGFLYVYNYIDAVNSVSFTGFMTGRIGNAGTAADFINPNTFNGIYAASSPVSRVDIVPSSGLLLAGMYLEVFGLS